ncbi:MAG: hypothetical protein JXR05_16995 [Flavobacteriaceae bacterium]
MKKIFFALGILSTFAFTDVSTPVENEDKVFCTISCSTVIDGITYSATAGNWFTSCKRAAMRCNDKLTASFYEE